MKLRAVQVTPDLERYMEALVPPRDGVLARLEEEADAEGIPAIGPQVGRLLQLLLRIGRCRDALELGTAIGYSAIWLARGCSGRVVTLESDPARAARARRNLVEAGLGERVEVVEEDGLGYLERMSGQVDCIFNDLLNSLPDEASVERCLQLSLQRLRPGGLLLADNALRRGQVSAPDTQSARNVDRYNRLVAAEPSLESVIVPLRDGVSIARLRD